MRKTFLEKEIITKILTGGKPLEPVMEWIYWESGWRESILQLLLKKNAKKEDAADVFQEGLAQLILVIRQRKFKGDAKLFTFLVSICKNIWHKQFARANHLTKIIDNLPPTPSKDTRTPELFLLQKEHQERLDTLLSKLGEKCKKVIGLWMLGYTIKEIVQKTAYKNENVVSKKKFYCTKELTALLMQQPKLVADLLQNNKNDEWRY